MNFTNRSWQRYGKSLPVSICRIAILDIIILSISIFFLNHLINQLPNNPVFNSLPNDKILDWSKLKALAGDKINPAEKLKFVLEMLENIVGKGENAGYQHFLLFPQCFQKACFSGVFKLGLCGKGLTIPTP